MPLITVKGTDNAVNTAYLPLITVLLPVHCSAQQWYNTTYSYRGQCHTTRTVLPALDTRHSNSRERWIFAGFQLHKTEIPAI